MLQVLNANERCLAPGTFAYLAAPLLADNRRLLLLNLGNRTAITRS